MEKLGHVLHDDSVLIYGIRRLARTGYIYIGSTVQPVETRLRRHLMDAKKKRHVNKRLAHLIRQSNFMVVADILDICPLHERAEREYQLIMTMHKQGHRLANQTNPRNPRQKLKFAK